MICFIYSVLRTPYVVNVHISLVWLVCNVLEVDRKTRTDTSNARRHPHTKSHGEQEDR